MIRMVGAVLLTGGSAALGFSAVRHLERRVQDLSRMTVGLEVVKRELQWRMAPLPELMERAAKEVKGRPGEFFRLCCQGAAHLNGRGFEQIWREALEAAQLRLEPSDLTLLEQLGGIMGRYDGDSQREALDRILIRLEEQRKEAAEQRSRLGKVYGMLGVTAGAFLMILLI